MATTSADYNADSEFITHDGDTYDEPITAGKVELSPFELTPIHKWPYPLDTYPKVPYAGRALLWDTFDQREVQILFCSIITGGPGITRPKRTLVYSTLSPPGIFIVEDYGAQDDPPQAAGAPYDPANIWPRYESDWLSIDLHDMDDVTQWAKYPLDYYAAHELVVELRAQELFRRQSTRHPCMPEYLGCYVGNGWVVELRFKRYPRNLHEAVESGQKLDVASIMSQLEDVVKRPPARAILIDYDTCFPDGAPLINKRGTRGFNEDDTWTHSSFTNDLHSLRCVATWLATHSHAQ
ncbi:hypothetical protein EXIGLDRAFT_733931 [Exidia glandulosa HHB12029]|uniref:Uncharacterized protein n=1 Tax=Exidia glandulosa HHB12029 TaxID=1314781 RepID=A0A165KBZ1_EXIGL|nr:hypothetical protein EXIGLDRAFT_733931 [Exidia glandulosa HHB12029]